MIERFLRPLKERHPGLVLGGEIVFVFAGVGILAWWVLRDLSRGQILRPMLAVMALALVSLRLVLTFRPNRPRDDGGRRIR